MLHRGSGRSWCGRRFAEAQLRLHVVVRSAFGRKVEPQVTQLRSVGTVGMRRGKPSP
jgi:hypothetical protein